METFTERTPRVVAASKLHRALARRRTGCFLAEGPNSVDAAVDTGVAVEVFATKDVATRLGPLVASARAAGVPVSPVSERAARSLSGTVTPTGLVAVCRSVVLDAGSAGATAPRLVAVGQALSDPGNVGTLIRVADALGVDEVWFTEGSADPENPKAVRASAGSLFHVPVIRGVPEADLVGQVREAGLQMLVASVDGEVDVERADALLALPTAWVFGNEAHGVSAHLTATADARVRIPIRGRAESLNIVTAASICLHTSARVFGDAP